MMVFMFVNTFSVQHDGAITLTHTDTDGNMLTSTLTMTPFARTGMLTTGKPRPLGQRVPERDKSTHPVNNNDM